MRILYVCHRLPFPPRRGGKIRPFHMIRHLHREHRVTVACLARSAAELREGAGLNEHCARVVAERVRGAASWARMVRRLASREPSSMGYFFSPRLARRVRAELVEGGYDLVFVHCSSVAQYVSGAQGVRKILDFGDMDSQKWLAYGGTKAFPVSLGYYLEGLKLQLAEMDLAQRFDYCTCTTRAELQTLRGYGLETPSVWIPNGVDTDYFRPSDEPYDPDTLCFVGRMDYYPNQACVVEFCERTLPLVRARRPRARLLVVGADPPSHIRRLAGRPGVEVTGSVPDVRPYLRRAALTIAPLGIARGTQNKILESLAIGVPCVCSVRAAAGVDAVPGEHLLTARTPHGYANAIARLLDDPGERRRLAEAGRARVLSHHSWLNSLRKLDQIIESVMRPEPRAYGAEVGV